MDGASALAGLVSVAGLAVQSTRNLIELIKSLKNVPRKLARQLRWLTQLAQLLQEIEHFCLESDPLSDPEQPKLLASYVDDCWHAVQYLSQYIESRIGSLEGEGRLRRNITRIRAVLASKEVDTQIEDIRKIVDGLHLCYLHIIRYQNVANLLGQPYLSSTYSTQIMPRPRISQETMTNSEAPCLEDGMTAMRLRWETNSINLQGMISQLHVAAFESSARLRNIEANLEWSSTVQALLPQEMYTTTVNMVRHQIAEPRPRTQSQTPVDLEQNRDMVSVVSLEASPDGGVTVEEPD